MSNRKLKILFVLQTPWGPDLGMSKVHYDLKIEFEKRGHSVDYFDAGKIYPEGNGLLGKIKGGSTQERIFKYLRANANKYDVIDANQRCVPYAKEDFGFKGLLVFRSHGLPPLYRIAELHPYYKRMTVTSRSTKPVTLRTHVAQLKRYLTKDEGEWALWDAIKYADVVHTLNESEYHYLSDFGVPQSKLVQLPNAVSDELLEQTRAIVYDGSQARSEFTFVGSWTPRKGITHLPEIFTAIEASATGFNLFGTGNEKNTIASTFPLLLQPKLNIKTNFLPSELPELLRKTKVGIFPSYVEGFGLAVIEMLAIGIPVVAFDVPGPSGILHPIDETLVVKLGDIAAFIAKVKQILALSKQEYADLSIKCYLRAAEFKNSVIADKFLEIYHSHQSQELTKD